MSENLAVMGADRSLTWSGHDANLWQALEDLRASGWMDGRHWFYNILGKGGCSTVYRVTRELQDGTQEHLAIKTPHTAEDGVMFAEEHRLMTRIPSAPRCIRANTGSTPYIVMECIEGKTLEELQGTGTAHVQAQLCQAIVRAMGDILNAGIVHGDIKPQNIMIAPGGSLRVIDFGVAVEAPPPHTRKHIGIPRGTPLYMAPEQWDGEIDRHTDVFSAGCLLYHELSGDDLALQVTGGRQSPHDIAHAMHSKDTAGTIHDIIAAAHVPMRHLLERMLRLDPDRRPDIGDIARSLQIMFRKALRKGAGLATMLSSVEQKKEAGPTLLVPAPELELPPTRRNPDALAVHTEPEQ